MPATARRKGPVLALVLAGCTMMLAAPRYLPETAPRRGQADVAGAVTSTLGMSALVFGIVRSAEAPPWPSRG